MPRRFVASLGTVPLLVTWLCQCQGSAAPSNEPAVAPPGGDRVARADSGTASPNASAPAPSPASAAPVISTPPDGGPSADAAAPPGDSAPPVASATPAPVANVAPVLLSDSGEPLAQTDERPTIESAFFQRLGPALFDAIVRDDPQLAMPFFFPLIAYEQVKAIERPERDWRYRLVRAFERNIHEYHRHLGRYRDQAQYVGIEVPEERARFMQPHTEGNRLPYWRVLRSQLVYRDHQGRRLRLEVTSLISWRGEWYVVHLNGFE